MKSLSLALLLFASFVLAQDNPTASASEHSKHSKGEVTVQGCVSRASGDYVLMKSDPSITYQLQATGKLRLRNYLGQRVEVTGSKSPTMSTSSDFLTKTGSASPETITISSIKTLDKECSGR
jgi:hypothetical protein